MPIVKEKDGTYKIDISLGFDPITGKRRRTTKRGFKTKKEAQEVYLQIRKKYLNSTLTNNVQMDFETLGNSYFKSIKETKKRIYQINQKYSFDKHILPYFKNSDIRKITLNEIKLFQEHLKQTELSNNTINKLIICLKQIFKIDVTENLIEFNPVENNPKLKVEKHEMKFWTPSQFKQFFDLIYDGEFVFKAFYMTAYLTGARCGELLALRWSDINFNTKTLFISKTLHKETGGVFLDTPKTKKSTRKVALNSQLIEILKLWKDEQARTIETDDRTFAFQYKDIPPVRDNFNKKIAYICNRGKIEKIRLHDFRHSHVAHLIDLGEDIVVIKERLGHSTITTTIDTYGHLFPTRQGKLAEKLDGII
jgi:integrase